MTERLVAEISQGAISANDARAQIGFDEWTEEGQ